MSEKTEDVISDFQRLVNMTATELERWLSTPESKKAGQSDTGRESKGHESGRRIVTLLRTKQADYTEEDVDHMRKVRGFVKRHLAQPPSGNVRETTWRYSLMNWGHDPLK